MDTNEYLFDEILNDTAEYKNEIILEERCKLSVMDEFTVYNTKHEAVIQEKDTNAYEKLNFNNRNFPHKSYPFELDTFQKIAIAAIEEDRSVLVSAHTSCGKTVVAEYAIAKSINNKQRVIYTSPIKALSNQKFRELQEEFTDVGLMTGDVTLNPDATVLVMTTEILRNMLYKGSEIVREIHWIIFDEIHYLKDRERGVVWEETLILLSNTVKCVFLSATIPNAREFAEWICKLSKQIVHVVYTEKRVIPLEHNFYSDQMYLVKKDTLNLRNVNDSMEKPLKRNEIKDGLNSCMDQINKPVVVFSFARAKCEMYAGKIQQSFLNTDEEEMVQTIFDNAISTLSKEDQELPAVQNMRSLFMKGIGVHHSGLLPIVKEIGEILFQEELIKVLFATESFSIGLNMPAKTVIFTALKKFDGKSERVLTSSEYCQMSGRAGRRGKDDRGEVVSLISEKLQTEDVVNLFKTSSDELKSAFRLTYNMILNLMRVEELDPTYFLEKSFYHYQAYSKAVKMEKEILAGITDNINININKDFVSAQVEINNFNSTLMKRNDTITQGISLHQLEKRFCQFYLYRDGYYNLIKNAIVSSVVNNSENIITIQIYSNKQHKFMEVHTSSITDVFEKQKKPSVMAFFGQKKSQLNLENIEEENNNESKEKEESQIESYNESEEESIHNNLNNLKSNKNINQNVSYKIINNFLECGICLLCGKTQYEGCSLKEEKCIETSEEIFLENIHKDSFDDTNIDREATAKLCKLYENNMKLSKENILLIVTNYRSYIINLIRKKNINKIKEDLKKAKEIYHMGECRRMLGVLRDLDYLDGNAVKLKGKMASEISSADEILLTEMIFNSSFNTLELQDMVALISILITERSNEGDDIVLSDDNTRLKEVFDESVQKIVHVMNRNNIKITTEEYTQSFNYYMMDIVKLWMGGSTFGEICTQTKVFEGSIIRAFKRLEEVLRQLSNAATVIGNNELVNLFSQGIYLIKRDIVFANSLYL